MTSKAEYILSGLRQRGMPDHIARGFVMNFQDESGLDSGIEEREFNVHGTKGFGLSQWTGPRRDALVSFASSRGKPISDVDTQLDYLMSELEGPESGAWSKIKNARTSGEAGAAIVNLFLRPAEKHRAERESRYLRDNDSAIRFDGFTDADGKENATLDYATAYEAPKAVSPLTYLEEESQAVQPYGSWLEEIGASYQSNAMTASVVRAWSEGTIDPTFEIGSERAAELSKHVPEHYLDFIMTSGSEEILRSRQKWMMDDIERQQKLAAGGWSAAGAGLVAGFIDPIPLVTGVATGGFGSAAMAARAGMAGKVAVGAAFGAAENAALEGVSGEVFDNPNADPGMAAAFGAAFGALGGALSRGPGGYAHPEAAHAFRLAGDANIGKMREHPDPILTADAPDLSAAGNTDLMKPLMVETRAYDTEVSDKDAAKGFGGKARFDVVGQMTTSDQPLVRVLGAHLGEETAGFTDHSVVPDSAASRATAYHRKFLGNYVAATREAEEVYIREVAGVRNGLFTPFKAAKAREQFNREVFEWVMDRNPSPDTHPSVVKAGQAFRAGMAGWRDEIERAGLANLNKDPHYIPMVSDAAKIAELDARISEDAMQQFFEHAIRKHTPTLSSEVVSRMATGYWRNIRRAGWGMENDMDRAMSTGDRAAFKDALLASLEDGKKLSVEQIDAAFEAVSGAMDGVGKDPNAASSRGVRALKKRTLMDYTFSAKVKGRNGEAIDLRVTDLFQQDADMLFRHYSRSMSGRVALAETKIENPSKPGYWITEGIKGEGDVAKLREAILEEARQMGKSPNDSAVQNQIKNLEFMYKRVAGIPVWDQNSAFAKWARRIKQMQFIRLMNNMGLNQVQESWKIATLTGYRAAYDQLPSIRHMSELVRSGGMKGSKLTQELHHMTGIGVEGLFSGRALRTEDERLGEQVSGKFGRKLDGALDHMSEITSQISLMRYIHDYQSNWAAAAITQQMANMARKTVSQPVPSEAVEELVGFSGTLNLRHGWSGKRPTSFSPSRIPSEIDPDRGDVFGTDGVYLDGTGSWSQSDPSKRWQVDGAVEASTSFQNALVVSPDTLPLLAKRMGLSPDERRVIPPDVKTWEQFHAWSGKLDWQDRTLPSALTGGKDVVRWAKENGFDGIIVRGFDSLDSARSGFSLSGAMPRFEGVELLHRLGFDSDMGQDQVVAFDPSRVSIGRDVDPLSPFETVDDAFALSSFSGVVSKTPPSSFDLSKLSKGDRDRLSTMGLGAKDAELLFRNILDNGSFDGRRVTGLNHANWDPDAVSKYRVFLGRYVDRLVQANDPGGLSKWMSHPVASMFVQFRSFVFGAWSKSTLWALNHGAASDPRMMVLLAGEVAFGAATYAVRLSPEIAKEGGWEEYKNKLLDPKGVFANGFARTASASVLPMLIDSALLFTPVEPLFGQARSSGSATDAFLGSPASDQLKSASNFTKGSLKAAFTDAPFTQQTAKHGLRAFAPFGNWLPVAAGFSALTRGLPEK